MERNHRMICNIVLQFLLVIMGSLLGAQNGLAEMHRSESGIAKGIKWPNSLEEEGPPMMDYAVLLSQKDLAGGYTELLPYVLPSPDQENAGSCLYMSHTGIAEWWLNRLQPTATPQSEGSHDLSERYTMNLSAKQNRDVRNWRTDSIFLFNQYGKAVLNKNYRYTKGSYKEIGDGQYVKASKEEPGALYGTAYNWIVDFKSYQGPYVSLPTFKREVIYKDPANNQWNVGIAPDDIVDVVKEALMERKAPLNVIYNHHGYWHSVILLGFNDNVSSSCSFVRGSANSLQKKANSYLKMSQNATQAALKARYLERSKNYENLAKKITSAMNKKECRRKGVFFVRDSIYSNKKESYYDYDLAKKGEETHYSSKIIHREYEWLEVLANHVVQIYVEE